MRRPRIRIWMMIVAVATLALSLIAFVVINNRRTRFAKQSAFHYASVGHRVLLSRGHVRGADGHMFHRYNYKLTDSLGKDLSQEKSDWHKAMGEKYKFASERPWMPVAPDPPEPK